MLHHQQAGLRYYTFAAIAPVIHGVSTRHGGVSQPPFDSLNLGLSLNGARDDLRNVQVNLQRWCAALDVDVDALVTLRQVHGVEIVQVTAEMRGRRDLGGDGLMTDVPGIPLMLRFADCTPLL